MNNGNISYSSIAILLFTVLPSSCLKETAVPIESAFTIKASEDKTAPVTIQLKNESYGADEYEWTFDGGVPSSSNQRAPGNIVFSQAGETVMQKIIPASELDLYLSGQYENIQVFITKAADTKHLKSFDDLYYGLRLDYDDTKFFLDEGYCYAIRFNSKEVPLNIIVPRGRDFKDPYPFTSHGFTAGTKGRIGVPEFATKKGSKISIEDGTEIWKITRDGKQTLYAVFENNTFKIIEQWK